MSASGAPARFDVRTSWNRVRDSWPAILQITITALASWAFAHYVLGHPSPLIAAIMVISALGFVRDARPVRVLETVLGMTLGIALAEALLLAFGGGLLQYGIALALTLLVARFLSETGAFAVAAAVQCSLVMLTPPPLGGPFTRTIDAVVGGVFALLATALIPRDPRRAATRAGRRLLAEHEAVFGDLATALRSGSADDAAEALTRARSLDALAAEWSSAVESGRAIARISPFLRRSRFDLERQAGMLAAIDLCTRSLRVLARRTVYVARDGAPRPAIADLFERVGTTMGLVQASLADVAQQPVARASLSAIAVHLDPVAMLPSGAFADRNLVQAVRPYIVDALSATGLDADDARAMLPSG
ncbi:FUSC family protein [Rathayibacter sp. YIM 133350]|uniref:FUSC family protein n=1 Tax=Rathayibacter sp. YIM 133350 TaxID=3131992 RepID=UPI00307D3D36